MPIRDYSPAQKALQINLDDSIYGTFAEIGAGQEVARHFFQAGRASHTIAKSISAYDMTFSDEIYGRESRYVCEARVIRMLDHEFSLLQERLSPKRGPDTRFFAFADTVATGTNEDRTVKSHGWMGIRFQARPGGPPNEIILHVRLWDRFRLQQQETLGVLGVNLIHLAFFPPDDPGQIVSHLIEGLSTRRVEVNMLRFSGPDFAHLDNRLLNLELVKQGLTEAILFGPKGQILHVGDELYGKSVLVQRGSFRPITSANLLISEKVFQQFQKQEALNDAKMIFEMTIHNLSTQQGEVNDEDFLHRVDTLAALGFNVMISNFNLFFQLKSFLRQYTDRLVGIVVGASLLPKMFTTSFYKSLPGGILEGMSRLFDDRTRVFVYPHKDATTCATAKLFHPDDAKIDPLYQYFLANQWIVDAIGCDDVDTKVHSRDVLKMIENQDLAWQKLVPAPVRKVIEERQLFGFRPGGARAGTSANAPSSSKRK